MVFLNLIFISEDLNMIFLLGEVPIGFPLICIINILYNCKTV